MENIDIKVNVTYNVQGGEQAAETLNKVREKAKQATDTVKKGTDSMKSSFIESADRFGLFESQIGRTFKKFYEGSRTVVQSMGAIKGAIAATGIGLLVIAVGLLVANWDKLSSSVDAGTTSLNGSKIADDKAREAMDKHIITLQNLQIEYDLTSGKITEFEAASKKLDLEYSKMLLDLSNNTEKEIGKIQSIWGHTWRYFKNGMNIEAANMEEQYLIREEMYKKDAEIQRINAEKKLKNDIRVSNSFKTLSELLKQQQEDLQTEIDNRNKEEQEKAKTLAQKIKTIQNDLYIDSLKTEEDKAKGKRSIQYKAEQNELIALGASKEQLKLLEKQYQKDILQISIDTANKKIEQIDKENNEYNKRLKERKDKEKAVKDELLYIDNTLFEMKEQNSKDYEQRRVSREQEQYNQDLQRRYEEGQINMNQMIQLKTQSDEIYRQLDEQAKQADIQREADRVSKKMEMAAGLANSIFAYARQGLDLEMQAELEALEPKKIAKTREEKMAQELEEKKEAIRKKFAKRQQKIDIAQALINTALSVTKTLADYPYPFSLIPAGLALVSGMIQVAMISRQKFATGGIVNGPKHSSGGTIIEAEGGEGIIRKEAMANPDVARTAMALNNGAAPLTEQRVAEIASIVAANIVKAVPVVVDRETANKIGIEDRKVQVREASFTR